jgi:hypothetical protein
MLVGRLIGLAAAALLITIPAGAQSTQGVILGRIVDSITGQAVKSASIECVNAETRRVFSANSGPLGFYAVPALSPGVYAVTVTEKDHQTQQARIVHVTVASRVELNFRLRPLSDLWEAGRFGTWRMPGQQRTLAQYGPDVDTSRIAVFTVNNPATSPLDTSRSDVIGQFAIANLPLTGRDVYTMLLLLPGVTADTGTARGLGFSTYGQRPSSSEYLLDGADNNALQTTGPLNTAAPEFIQEYRVSVGSFTAEYGRTSGFIANAITRGAGNDWHAMGFFYLENRFLNANGFQENASGFARAPMTQVEGGFTGGGPIIRRKLLVSGGLDVLRTKSLADPQWFALPTASFIQSTSPSSYSGAFLRQFPLALAPAGPGDAELVSTAPPTDFSRSDVYARADYAPNARNRVSTHFLRDALDEPQFLYSPYADSSTPYRQTSLSIAADWTRHISAAFLNELRASRTGDSIRFESPASSVPQLTLFANAGLTLNGQTYPIILPGPQNPYNYRNRGASWDMADTLTSARRRHLWKAGAGVFQRSVALNLAFTPGGYLLFPNFDNFARGIPNEFQVEVDRYAPGFAPVQPDRNYRYRQAYGFAQDSVRLTDKLTLDLGLRYEWYGSPVNTGATKDTLIALGSGAGGIQSALISATAVTPSSGQQTFYSRAGANLAPRVGLAWDITGSGKTIARASYGIFYDRPFDNLWENAIQNRYLTAAFQMFAAPLAPGSDAAAIAAAGKYTSSSQLVNGLVFQPGFRAPRVQHAFVGLQRAIHEWISLEGDAIASRGRALITTDIVNRALTLPQSADNPFGYLNPAFSQLDYRANQGKSQYAALSGTVQFRRRTLLAQFSYTWSHSQDNQSEPLANAFFDLNQFSQQGSAPSFFSAFTKQFDSNADWASSDFDQRRNFVFYAAWSPALPPRATWLNRALRNWTVAGLAAKRSGMPFSVYANQTTGFTSALIVNERADLLAGVQPSISAPGPGGRYLLNSAAFISPAGAVGNTGRNEFTGPGLFSADASVARAFPLPVRESARLILRADAYNVLNHANLNNPDSRWSPGSATFGLALAGRVEGASGFPLLLPLRESARIVQLMARFEF